MGDPGLSFLSDLSSNPGGTSSPLQTFNDTASMALDLTDASFAGQGSSLQDCIAELVANLAVAQYTGGYSQSATFKYVSDLLTAPYNELKHLGSVLFSPPSSSGAGVSDPAINTAYLESVAKAMLNPSATLWTSQLNILADAADNLFRNVVWDNSTDKTGNQSAVQAISRTSMVLKQLIMDGTNASANVGGLIQFGCTEAIPAIESELTYIRKLKAAMRNLVDQTAGLPPSMIPGLPNAAASEALCWAERYLAECRDELHLTHKFNKSLFSQAGDKVCEAKSDIYDPGAGLGANFANQLKNAFGLNDLQFNTLRAAFSTTDGYKRLMPNPQFRLQSIYVMKLNALIQATDPPIIQFYANLKKLQVTLSSLNGLYLADIFAQLIEVLRREIHMIRLSLEADAAGLNVQADLYNIDALRAATPAAAKPKSNFAVSAPLAPSAAQTATAQQKLAAQRSASWAPSDPKNPKPNANVSHTFTQTTTTTGSSDVYSYLGNQAAAYSQLVCLCTIMDKVQYLYSGIQRILNGEDAIMNQLRKFLGEFDVVQCGDPAGADNINTAVKAFLKVAEARLAGTVKTNDQIYAQYQSVISACEAHERFLLCLQSECNRFLGLFGLSTQIIAAAMNIAALAKRSAALYKSLRNANLATLGGQGESYNSLDAIVKALQCLILQCNNPFLSATARAALRKFQADSDRIKSSAITFGQLDEAPGAGAAMGNNARLQAFFKLIQALQRLTSMNIEDLCKITPAAIKVTPATPKEAKARNPVVNDSAQRAAAQEAQRQAAAAAAEPYGTGD